VLGGTLRATADEAATGKRHGTAAHAAEAGARVPVGHAAGIAEGGRIGHRPQQRGLAQVEAAWCADGDVGGFNREPRLFPAQAEEDRGTGPPPMSAPVSASGWSSSPVKALPS
jgi:hypothetical protein